MATFTITTPVNIDTLAGKTGSDTYNINGGYLTVDQHSRYGTNQNTSAALGNITLSASLGGTVEFNSTLVRLIPFDTGTGNVPALDTNITQGGASGKLLGVYSALNAAPTAAGAAMPASGFILIRQWNSVGYTASTLTGISANATDVDRAGWLEIVGVDAFAVTVNRLNLFKVRGDYFDFLGITTSGTRTTTYQIPTNGSSVVYLPGVEVETGTGTGVYEFYPCAGSITALAANIATDEVRGKVCWIAPSTGLVSFGYDGTNQTGGYVPPAGRKIRIPNIFFMCCTAAAPTVNVLPNATLASRMEFATTGGGAIDIDKASVNWYMNFSQPFSVTLSNCYTLSSLVLSECASSISWTNVGVGQEAANTQIALSMSLNFAGGTMTNCTWSRATQAASGAYVTSWSDCSGFTLNNHKCMSLIKAANATTGSMILTRVTNSTWNNTTLGGGRVVKTTCNTITFNNTIYYDHPATTTRTAIPMFAYDIASGCTNISYDGLSFGGLTLCQPYSGILQIGAAGCTNIKLRNLGTPSVPLDLGGEYVNATWTRSTTTMTITKTAHGLKVNDLIAVNIVSDVAPKAVTTSTATLWTIASVPTADTFTVTVTNAGGTSGTMSYYPTMSGTLVTLAAGAASNNVKIQRCYTQHLRTGVLSGDNSSKNVTMENVWGTEWGVQLIPELNCITRGIISTPALTAQTSVYGSHFIDYYTTGIPTNVSDVAWTRTTTTATITSASHGLRTGDIINITMTSDASAIIKGQKTITATTDNTFTFTCLNAGSTSGTLTFKVYNGRIAIQMNEPTSDTTSQVSLQNGAAFTSAGSLYMPTINQQADFTFPINLKGHSNFPIAEAVMAGGTLTNYHITYSLDNGLTYNNLYYSRAGGGGSSASTTVTMTDTTNVSVGDYVFGTNIAPNAIVQSVINGTTIEVDTPNIGTVSGILRFNHLPSDTVDSLAGTPLKVRIKTTTTNTTAITSLFFYTNNTSTDRTATYPLDLATLNLTGLISGSDIVLLQPGTSTEYANVDNNIGTTYAYSYDTSIVSAIDIAIYKSGYVPYFIRNLPVTVNGASVQVSQVQDRAYV